MKEHQLLINMKNEIKIIDEKSLENKIYTIRGQKVMLDSDLAEIYGYSTKRFNEQVKNNKEKFSEDFMFQLTNEEIEYISSRSKKSALKNENYLDPSRSKILTLNKSNNKRGFNIKYRPFVFTESGIYMLMTVLKGELATKQSIALIRLFRSMKDCIYENTDLLSYRELEDRTFKLENDVNGIKGDLSKVMDNFIDPSTYKHFLILNGRKLEADIAYKKIFSSARESIIYIDDYIGIKTLNLLSFAKKNVTITIVSDNKSNNHLKEYMINDYIEQNKNNKLALLKSNNICHDRYIIIDFNTDNEMIYHCGASCKDAGNKVTSITRIEAIELYKPLIKKLLKMPKLKLL